ncbi:MAG TPA: hypothetical protein VGC41_19055, partial [Kofleriaceae bacterium]
TQAMKLRTLASCSLLSSLVACSNSSSDTVTTDEYDDVAQNVATSSSAQNGGDVSAMSNVVLVASGSMPLGFSFATDGMITGTLGGITYSFSLTCRDASGTTQITCSSQTDLADAKLDVTGALNLPGFSTTLDRHGEWSMMNLQEPSVKLAGNGTFSYDSSITNASTGSTAAYHFDYEAAYMSVFIDKQSGLATSGEIDYAIAANKTVDGTQTRSFSVDADVTFDGDGTATLVLDGMHHYKIDLSTHVVVKID